MTLIPVRSSSSRRAGMIRTIIKGMKEERKVRDIKMVIVIIILNKRNGRRFSEFQLNFLTKIYRLFNFFLIR